MFTLEPKDELTTHDVLEAACVGPDALFKSKGDMRRMLQQGGVYLNGRRLGPEREPLSASDLLGGEFILLRKGARSYALDQGAMILERGPNFVARVVAVRREADRAFAQRVRDVRRGQTLARRARIARSHRHDAAASVPARPA